jgi:hypothetical protein
MIIKEFRVVLPLTVEEYQVAQLYTVAEASKDNTGGGEGIEVLKNEPYSGKPLLGDKYTTGQYTYKIYHLDSKVPAFIKLIAPKGSLEIHEEAWNAYPYCRTIITNPGYMKDNFYITIETMHKSGKGDEHNAHELPADRLQKREVVKIDIANDSISSSDYKEADDPKKFRSSKTGRGPLNEPDWINKVDPVMTCYKLVTVEFKWFGIQNKIEAFTQRTERRLFTNFHRQLFCLTDSWYGLTMDDIRRIEDKTKFELDKAREEGCVRGMKGEE